MEKLDLGFNRECISKLALLIGSGILVIVFSIFAFSMFGFYFGAKISAFSIFAAVIATLIFIIWASKRYFKNYLIPTILTLLSISIIITSMTFMVSKIYDVSWDGQEYEQKAVIDLANGWNPVQEELPEEGMLFTKANNHYPKLPWVISTAMYKFTGNIEAGKAFNIILMFSVFFIALSFLLRYRSLKPSVAVIIALLFAANPVCITQSFALYIDNQVAVFIFCMVCFFILEYIEPDAFNKIMIAISIAACVNVKFTAVAYAGIICIAASIVYLFYKNNKKAFVTIVLGSILGFVVVGFHPYVTNTIYHHQPLYPVYGSEDRNEDYLMNGQRPTNLEEANRFERFFVSLFSKSEDVNAENKTSLKLPFTVYKSEFSSFRLAPDLRVGGFGPLFALIFLLAIGAVALRLSDMDKFMIGGLFIAGVIFVSVIINKECWWARYTPQTWLIPLVIFTAYLIGSEVKIQKAFATIFIIICIINVAFIGVSYYKGNVDETKKVVKEIEYLKKQDRELLVYVNPSEPDGGFRSNLVRFEVNGIKYKEVFNDLTGEIRSFANSQMKYAFADGMGSSEQEMGNVKLTGEVVENGDGSLAIFGEGFNGFAKVFVDGSECETEYASEKELNFYPPNEAKDSVLGHKYQVKLYNDLGEQIDVSNEVNIEV